MLRYCRPLGVRLCREIEASAQGARFVPALTDAGSERLALEGGIGELNAIVDLSAPHEGLGFAGITIHVVADRSREGEFRARLSYAPALNRFEAEVSVAPDASLGAAFDSLWAAVCRRHPDVADFDRSRRAFEAAGRPGARGLVFAGPDGPFLPADEYTFLLVRDAGRALSATLAPLLAGAAA
jgi:hypothetical protein